MTEIAHSGDGKHINYRILFRKFQRVSKTMCRREDNIEIGFGWKIIR
jgi:hypothetical protein